MQTLVREGATIGAQATIGPGLTIGRFAMIGMGSVVTRDVPDFCSSIGNPAERSERLHAAGAADAPDDRGSRRRGPVDAARALHEYELEGSTKVELETARI